MEYNLEDRTEKFSKSILRYLKTTRRTLLNNNIIDQLLRSASSVGANYSEANGASSKKDFRNKIFLCKKEIQETKYWIQLLIEIENSRSEELSGIYKESYELCKIFGSIAGKLNKKL